MRFLFFFLSGLLGAGGASLATATPTPGGGPSQTAARTAAEALCGPEIVLIGDAWEHVQLERDAVISMTSRGELEAVPSRLAALASHLHFIQNRAVMVFGSRRQRLVSITREVEEALPHWSALALAGRTRELTTEWPRLHQALATFRGQIPEEALISSSEASFLLPPVIPTTQIHLSAPPALAVGGPVEVRFRLIGGDTKPVLPDFLHTTHTEKLHALLLDPLFQDYHHEHPQPTGVPGEYRFTFTPRVAGPYRLWLDAMPVATGRTEFPIVDLARIPRPIVKAPAPSAPVLQAEAGGFLCQLEVPEGQLVFARDTTVTLRLRDAQGVPLTRLQPLMGAFAHVVGFADDFQTIHHIHPLGAMPQPGELGGPTINFRLRASLPGWIRLYVQFAVDDATHLAAFAVPVVVE